VSGANAKSGVEFGVFSPIMPQKEKHMYKKYHLWRRTPPAIFPVTLGFTGLGLAWRNAAGVLPIPHEIGDLMLGLSTAYFLFFAVSYLAKMAARPSVVLDDLNAPSARAGVAAFPMSIMLLAAALLPFGVEAREVWWIGVVTYYFATGLVTWSILTGPKEGRKVSPFQYLAYVGPIVGPIAGIPLGYVAASFWLTMFSLVAYVIITLGYYPTLLKHTPPPPLRPSLAIVLAATSLFGLAFGGLNMEVEFQIFYWLAVCIAVVLLASSMWLAEGGWNPVWGAFTFPVATFTNLQILAVHKGMGAFATGWLIAGLAIGTPLILYIVWMASKLWIRGELARISGAAVA